jgi:hypothetical protein
LISSSWQIKKSIRYQGQSFRIDIFKLADQKINPKGLTPIVRAATLCGLLPIVAFLTAVLSVVALAKEEALA